MHNDKNILRCPFCESPLSAPVEIKGPFGNIISGGNCECGVSFVYDRSGRNLGEAYIDVLSLLCDGNMDKAWSLVPETDYDIKELSFDIRRNRFLSSTRRAAPTFLFVRFRKV